MIELTDAEFACKRAAAQAYDDVRVFVEEAIRRFGESAFLKNRCCEHAISYLIRNGRS